MLLISIAIKSISIKSTFKLMILMVLPLTLTIYNQVNNVNYPKLLELLIGMNGPQKREDGYSTSVLWNNIKTP